MQPDLFTTDPDPDHQDHYRELLRQSWEDSLRVIRDRGEIPPWVEADNLLDQDELRVLKLVDSHAGYIEGERVVVEYEPDAQGLPVTRHVSRITRDAGFHAEANAVAVINRCIAREYLVRKTYGHESRLEVGVEGRWRLDAIEADEYWSE